MKLLAACVQLSKFCGVRPKTVTKLHGAIKLYTCQRDSTQLSQHVLATHKTEIAE
jgi:NAD-dependent SIR2 family protein deacetylase